MPTAVYSVLYHIHYIRLAVRGNSGHLQTVHGVSTRRRPLINVKSRNVSSFPRQCGRTRAHTSSFRLDDVTRLAATHVAALLGDSPHHDDEPSPSVRPSVRLTRLSSRHVSIECKDVTPNNWETQLTNSPTSPNSPKPAAQQILLAWVDTGLRHILSTISKHF